jgi:3-oxoacyl-[acyl-carrier-protein] synthase I
MSDRPSPSPDAYVVGVGARSPVGATALASAAAVRAGVTRLSEHPYMINRNGDPFSVAMVPGLKEGDHEHRIAQLATSAISEVLQRLPCHPNVQLPVFFGLPETGPSFSLERAKRVCQYVVRACASTARLMCIPACEGNASLGLALAQALIVFREQSHPFVLVGAADSLISAEILESLDTAGRLAREDTRWGFHPGEGAAFFALASLSFARANRLPILGRIAALENGLEPARLGTDTICVGKGLAAVLRAAAVRVSSPVSRQYCDIDGERYREHEFSYAVLRVPAPLFEDALDYVAPADAWGHVGAATQAMLATLPLLHHQRGRSPGRWPMVWAGSENGKRSALIFDLQQSQPAAGKMW